MPRGAEKQAGPSSAKRSDSVPLDSIAEGQKNIAPPRVDFKTLLAVFVIFILVVSSVFTDNVVSKFRGAVECRTLSSYGVVIQGIFLVIFYILAIHMIDGDFV